MGSFTNDEIDVESANELIPSHSISKKKLKSEFEIKETKDVVLSETSNQSEFASKNELPSSAKKKKSKRKKKSVDNLPIIKNDNDVLKEDLSEEASEEDSKNYTKEIELISSADEKIKRRSRDILSLIEDDEQLNQYILIGI